MNRKNITPTVECGLISAIAVILGLASTYLPVIGILIDFFWAVPFAVLTIRQGVKRASYALIATIILLSMFIGSILTIRLALSFGFCGLILGFAVQQKFSAVKIFILTLMVSFAAQVLTVALLMFVMDINVLDTQIATIRESFEQSFAMYKSMGVDDETITQAREQVEPAITLLSLLMPTLLLIMALINTTTCFYTAKWIFPKIQMSIPEFPPFSQWRFPNIFLYLMILALLGLYWGSTRNLQVIYTISVNANILALFAGFVQGLSLLSFAANHYNISKFLRRFIFIVIIFNFTLFQVISFAGLFDMIFDYRRRFSERK